MADFISYLAWRAVNGAGVQPGELIVVMDHAGRDDVLRKVLLNIELAGATPLPEIAPPDHLAKVLYAGETEHIAQMDRHRAMWMQQCDRIIVLSGGWLDLKDAPAENIQAWSDAQARLAEIEEAKRTPNFVVAVPNEAQAQRLGVTLEELERILHDPIVAPLMDLQNAALRIQHKLAGERIVIRSGAGCELRMAHGSRPVLIDDGYIDDNDRARGAVVSNLPAGSVYTTVIEDSVQGALFMPQAGDARDVTLHFSSGRVNKIEAASGADEIEAMFDGHAGESRRIGHIGIGANPHLRKPIGWTLVDEHVWGALYIAFGENRYMGGENESALNEDFALHNATLEVDGAPLLQGGRIVL
jgi:leucyl aminopeptidase (aminopeptidase T)